MLELARIVMVNKKNQIEMVNNCGKMLLWAIFPKFVTSMLYGVSRLTKYC